MDLIYAEATPPGRGGVSLVRLSGDGARAAAETLVGPMVDARHAYFRELVDGDDLIDQVLALRFDSGASFTGEEVVELHLHGAPVIVRRVCRALSDLGARQAEAGEFTRRAFINGRMDLAEIEGLGDLLAAETEAQRRLAVRLVGGEVVRKANIWRQMLIEAGALVEVSVDFADEDVPDEVPSRVFDIVARLRAMLQQEVDGFQSAERVRMGFEVAIIGPPNVGKSSLLNYLARRDVALVSDVAGTTRDVIELRYDLRGLPVTFLDTAGLRETSDLVETMGVDVARRRAAAADLRLHLTFDGTAFDGMYCSGDVVRRGLGDQAGATLAKGLSAATGDGVDAALDEIFMVLSERISGASLISHERQRSELDVAVEALRFGDGIPAEVVAEHLRLARHALDRLTGRIGAEDYLDVIFSSFCIGK